MIISLMGWKPHQRLKSRLITSPWGGLAFFLGSFLLMGGWRHREQSFQVAGTGPALAALVVLCTMTLVLVI